MIFKEYLITILVIAFLSKETLACQQVLTCEHDGKFNNNTCVCDCFPSYSGSEFKLKVFIKD